jgi:hypothetical protein
MNLQKFLMKSERRKKYLHQLITKKEVIKCQEQINLTL